MLDKLAAQERLPPVEKQTAKTASATLDLAVFQA
jgi:hypothetical protein